MSIYLDNAATTPLAPEAFEAMKPYLIQHHGNPSTPHTHGRQARAAVESARKAVAKELNVTSAEVYFTAGGTESTNIILHGAVRDLGCEAIITSPLEHSATLKTAEYIGAQAGIPVYKVKLDASGLVDMQDLEALLKKSPKALVSLMHGNNEIGNLTDLKRVGDLCHEYGAFFHTDAVQSLGFERIDPKEMHIDALSGTGHKFHGPKGIGFLYLGKGHKISAHMQGGGQEKGLRSGTENVYAIVGLASALTLAYANLERDREHILGLKNRMIERLKADIPGVLFNGASADSDHSLCKILSVSIPTSMDTATLLFSLDLQGVSATGGSACSSGAQKGSHVLMALGERKDRVSIRFSFSRYNTIEEIETACDILKKVLFP
ncbi:cysteine desulfurase [Fulvitalea axinellae]|uniref:cysteine desulfurase n=1 Tax=Fulvitalea axinellae TaxID=1182444 RepID=A0AAU9CTM7_9BACT|nr:cysteine desulfurase [Fulvitalea axinellae]